MADDITQRLGLDASQAISTLKDLATSTQAYAKQVTALTTATAAYNKVGRVMANIITALGGGGIKNTVTTMNKLVGVQNKLATATSKAAAAQRQQSAAVLAQRQQKLAQVISGGISIPQGASNTQIRQIQSLTGAIAETATKAGVSFREIRTIANNLGKVYTGPSRKIANDLQRINRLLANVATQGQETSKSLTLSWASVIRIFTIQTVQRALGLLSSALRQAITDAIQFETQLAQILTIAPTLTGLDQAKDAVRGLSEEFARPIEDVAEGFYNILSNQIGEASDSALVLRQSLILSTAAVSSAADAADALSSIINSYNLNASDAADLTGKLFAAVDVGRFTLDEIANSLGRVTALAAPLGVSIDEVLASLSTLTINGIKADEAMTLLSNALRGVLKPTEAMQRAFAELGVANGEAGIAAFGLQGFLQRLTETTNGTASEITQLTENIRVGRGVFGVTGKAADQYAKSLEAIEKATANTARDAADLVLDTNAQQVQIELTKLRNFFVNDFGRAVLPLINNVTKAFGGSVNAVTSLIKAVLAVGTAFAVFKTGILLMNAYRAATLAAALATSRGLLPAIRVVSAAMLTIPGAVVIVAITAAVIALTGALNGVDFEGFNEGLKQAAADANEAITRDADARTIVAKRIQDAQEKTIRGRFQAELQLVANLNRLYNDDVKNAADAQAKILDNLKDQVQERAGIIDQITRALEKNIQDSADSIRDTRGSINDLFAQERTRRFDRSLIGLDETRKAVKLLQAAESQRNRQVVAGTKAEVAEQEKALETAARFASQAQQLGDSTGNVGLQVRAERELQSIFNAQVALKERSIQLDQKQAQESQKRLAEEKARQAQAKELIKEFDRLAVISSDTGRPIIERENAKKSAENLAGQLEAVFSGGGRNLSLEEFLGIRELEDRLRRSFTNPATGLESSLTDAVTGGIDVIFEKLDRTRSQFAEEISALEAISGKEFTFVSGFEEVSNALVTRLNDIVEALNRGSSEPQLKADLAVARNNLALSVAQIEAARQGIVEEFSGLTSGLGDSFLASALTGQTEQLKRNLTTALREAIAAAGEGNAQPAIDLQGRALFQTDKLQEFIRLNREFAPENEKLTADQIKLVQTLAQAYADQAAQLSEVITKSADLQRINLERTPISEELQGSDANRGAALEQVKRTQDELNERNIKIQNSVKGIGPAAAQGASAANNSLSSLNSVVESLANNSERAALALASIGGGSLSTPQTAARGGRIKYFADGGFVPKGTDTVPAMLSPGEVVINAKSSRKFYSQLMAINAGRTPIYRQNGGPVTNNTISGDVSINVQGQASNKATGREVLQTLRREFRRGTGKI